jgi:AraC-like DNA-binding protein
MNGNETKKAALDWAASFFYHSSSKKLSSRERAKKISEEIERFVKKGKGFLDPHLKIDNVVDHCSYSRTYVSHVFKTRYGGFSRYVNTLRLEYYDRYLAQHPSVTKDTAAQESGFISYIAYYKVKERLERE